MKKILTLALCLAAVGSMSAQKANVDAAKKLSGKEDKIAEARDLIKAASQNPETANDVYTYFVGGKVEFDAYDKARTLQMINPQDEKLNPMNMAEQVINGYKMYLRALPLDSVPNEKGQVKPKYSKDIVKALNGHINDYFTAGGTYYDAKKYYPEAFEAFSIYGDMPDQPFASKVVKEIPDSTRALSYYYAGISGYAGNSLPDAAKVLKKARKLGINDHQSYIYELACWQNMAANDSTLADVAKKEIEEIARDGFAKFGMSQPVFLNNLVNSLVQEQRYADAIDVLNQQLAKTPDNAALYGLMGFVYDRQDKTDDSVNAYLKAASFPDADFETLKMACRKLLRTGTELYDKVDRTDPAAKEALKAKYFLPASEIGTRANSMKSGDSDLEYLMDAVNYALETYFGQK